AYAIVQCQISLEERPCAMTSSVTSWKLLFSGIVFTSIPSNVSRPSNSRTLCGIGKVYVHGAVRPSPEPFHLSAEFSFTWRPFDAARAYAREEDLLTELVGRRKQLPKTERRWKRVDLSLHAGLPYGSTAAMPPPQLFGAWTASILEKVHGAFAEV